MPFSTALRFGEARRALTRAPLELGELAEGFMANAETQEGVPVIRFTRGALLRNVCAKCWGLTFSCDGSMVRPFVAELDRQLRPNRMPKHEVA